MQGSFQNGMDADRPPDLAAKFDQKPVRLECARARRSLAPTLNGN